MLSPPFSKIFTCWGRARSLPVSHVKWSKPVDFHPTSDWSELRFFTFELSLDQMGSVLLNFGLRHFVINRKFLSFGLELGLCPFHARNSFCPFSFFQDLIMPPKKQGSKILKQKAATRIFGFIIWTCNLDSLSINSSEQLCSGLM